MTSEGSGSWRNRAGTAHAPGRRLLVPGTRLHRLIKKVMPGDGVFPEKLVRRVIDQ